MSEPLIVLLGDDVAGTIERLPGGKLRFDYDEAYMSRSAATPLSVSMPLQVRSHPDRVITPWLWGLLPDNDAVLARWAREFQVSASSPFSLLSTPIGHDCAGAVRFVIPAEVDEALSRKGRVAWLSDDGVAQRLRELRHDSTAWLGRNFTGQFSLAGAQSKTALLQHSGRWGVPSGSMPTTHILKPAITGFDDHDLNEHLCLDAARRAGLLAVRTQVVRFGPESAVVVERYDRRPAGHTFRRVHQEDLCQTMSVPPSSKYQSEGGPGPREIAGLLRRVLPPGVAYAAVWRFTDALIWNWLIAGTDAHAKNYSILLSGTDVRLAPLYDISSALPYGAHEKKLRLAMKIGGDYGLSPSRSTWLRAASELRLAPEKLVDRVRELAELAPDAFSEAAKAPGVIGLHRALPAKLADLVAERVSRCLRQIG